ncbi:MAG: hypothetical protein AB1921_03785 [Thermodesulfobacteriota bacterium]
MIRKTALLLCAMVFLAVGQAWAKMRIVDAQHFMGHENGGVHYLRVVVENLDFQPLDYTLDFTAYDGFLFTVSGYSLPPGEKRLLHIPVVADQRYLKCRLRDSSGFVSEEESLRGETRPILHMASLNRHLDAADADFLKKSYYCAVKKECNPKDFEDEPPALLQRGPETCPDNWLCLLVFQSVVTPEDEYLRLAEDAKTVLSRYVEAGGWLFLYGALQEGGEDRLLGKVVRTRDNPLTASQLQSGLTARDRYNRPKARVGGGRKDFPYLPERLAGTTGGLALATLFFILAGPVNYIYFRRKKMPRALLVSLPAISLVFCLLITVLFFASKGFSRQGGTVSLTLLDEEQKSALCVAHHVFLSGLYPRGGLSFDGRTGFFSEEEEHSSPPVMELSGKLHLLSGLILPSVPFVYATEAPFMTREKILVADGRVQNGLSFPIAALVLRREGKWYKAGPVAPGAGAALVSADEGSYRGGRPQGVAGLMVRILRTFPEIPAGELSYWEKNMLSSFSPEFLVDPEEDAYMAVLKGGPSQAWPGLSMGSDKQAHLIVGKMARSRNGETASGQEVRP